MKRGGGSSFKVSFGLLVEGLGGVFLLIFFAGFGVFCSSMLFSLSLALLSSDDVSSSSVLKSSFGLNFLPSWFAVWLELPSGRSRSMIVVRGLLDWLLLCELFSLLFVLPLLVTLSDAMVAGESVALLFQLMLLGKLVGGLVGF